MAKSTFRFAFLIMVILSMITGCTTTNNPIAPGVTGPSLGTHQVTSSDLNLQEMWRYKSGFPNPSPDIQSPPFLFYSGDSVILSSSTIGPGDDNADLTALSMTGGTVLWQIRLPQYDFGSTIESAYLDTSISVLFLYYGFRVCAFNIKTGERLWTSSKLQDHEGYVFAYLQLNDSLILDSTNLKRYIINKSTGKIINIENIGLQNMREQVGNISILNAGSEAIKKYNLDLPQGYGFVALDNDHKLLWHIDDYANFWPIAINNNKVLFQFGKAIYQLWEVDIQTGEVKWKFPFIVSNYSLDGDTVYALTNEQELVALNVEDGQLTGYMQFDHDISEQIGNRPFWVMAEKPFILIYFGDTQELIAFRNLQE
jgi:outer membrane protein assembly factor BamB